MLLWEAIQTVHYRDRKKERGTIRDIELPEQVYRGRDREDTNSTIISTLQEQLNKRLTALEESKIGRSNNVNLGIKLFSPVLQYQDKKYPIPMDSGNGKGTSYLTVVANDNILTVYLTYKESSEDIVEATKDHLRRERPAELEIRPPAAYIPTNSTFVVDINGKEVVEKEEKPEIQKVSEETLDYTVRTDYRIGSTFEHEKYGKGKVVSASGAGKAGTSGVVDWIEVDFGKPYLKGGKLQTTRRFEDILTKAYFGKTLKNLEVAIKETKGTCCGKCGHVHVKGTTCPKPHLSGKRHCSRRTNEMHTAAHDGPDEFHQVRADHEETIHEMSLSSIGIPEFLEYVRNNPLTLKYFGFPSYKNLEDYILGADVEEWYELQQELEDYKQRQSIEETSEFCHACLAEYLIEHEHKLVEAEYRGRKVTLGKPFLTPGGPKKRSVYVKNAKGNVVKVNFGDPNLRIKKSNPKRRKSFRARHKCHTAKDRTTPRYWSCKFW